MVIKYLDILTEKITANELKKHLIIRYEDQPLFIQSDWLQLTNYGVPKNDKFHTTEESRRYIQIPLVDNHSFTNFIKQLDEYFSSDKFRTKYLTEKQQDMTYIPIYKEGNEKYQPSMKFKIIVDEKDNVVSEFFHNTKDGIVKQYVGSMDNIKEVFSYMSEFRLMFKVQKIWFMSRNYGVKLQLMKAQIKPPTKNKEVSEFID
jgi:hypothetical protein